MLPHVPLRRPTSFSRLVSIFLLASAVDVARVLASPSQTGSWSGVYSWPDVAIHMSVRCPTGGCSLTRTTTTPTI